MTAATDAEVIVSLLALFGSGMVDKQFRHSRPR